MTLEKANCNHLFMKSTIEMRRVELDEIAENKLAYG